MMMMTMLVLMMRMRKRFAMGTIGIRFDADCLIVFAEYDSRLVFGDVFGTHVRVHGNVFATVRVVGVFVVAHVDQLARIDE